MSTEQRDKALTEWQAEVPDLRKFNEFSGSFTAGWDAHAATMPDREALAATVKHVIETEMNYDDDDWGLIADAVLALLDKED